MDNDLDRVLAYYDDKSQADIRRALESSYNPVWNHTRMVAMCQINRKVDVVPVFTVNVNGEDQVVTVGCRCGGNHELYADEELESGVKRVKCPKCGHEMTVNVIGYWD